MKQFAWSVGLLLVCGPGRIFAADAPPPPKLEPIPELPAPVSASAPTAVEEGSEVLTREEGGVRIEEYRRKGGQLYLVKVTPRVGAPYYLMNPTDAGANTPSGDGRDKGQGTPSWIIKSW